MSYDILEKQIKALPPNYYSELVDYLEFLTEKAEKEKAANGQVSLQKMREASLKTVWETVKNDTW